MGVLSNTVMSRPRAQIGRPLQSSLALVLALVSLLLGMVDLQTGRSLVPEPLSGSLEVFMAAAHPLAPPHLDGAGLATYRKLHPPFLRLIKSIGTEPWLVVAMLGPGSPGALVAAEVPQLSPGAHSCRGFRGPPACLS